MMWEALGDFGLGGWTADRETGRPCSAAWTTWRLCDPFRVEWKGVLGITWAASRWGVDQKHITGNLSIGGNILSPRTGSWMKRIQAGKMPALHP